ncbi:hypothetical protein MHBO_000664 [Bonamia ostreae]|uniref:Phosphatidate cytidylyltransferase, mitochondrial n=1 Tax=Bonamia ostreae TaxID=126728 RepID=A0ABV2AH12_9EUKA
MCLKNLGDLRLYFAEDRKKTQLIANGSFQDFVHLYKKQICGYLKFLDSTNLSNLDKNLHVERKTKPSLNLSKNWPRKFRIIAEDKNLNLEEKRNLVLTKLAKTVRKSSFVQALSNFATCNFSDSHRYIDEKLNKYFSYHIQFYKKCFFYIWPFQIKNNSQNNKII